MSATISDHMECQMIAQFLSDPGVPGVRSIGPDVSQSIQEVLQT